MFGSNIKVHYAGYEVPNCALIPASLGARYSLYTVYPFICSKFGIERIHITTKNISSTEQILKEIASLSKHSIMDSGLFTLMFGANKGRRDEKFISEWMETLCDFVNHYGISSTCVEVDCQRVLGVEQAWRFRERMRELLPNNRIINVFHLPDGRSGLDRLIEYSDYIAISIPEWRLFAGKKYPERVHQVASYIKNKKPEIDIHLLGCTEMKMLESCRFCTSSDSTSWMSGFRFGNVLGKNYNSLKMSVVETYRPLAIEVLDRLGYEKNDKRVLLYSKKLASTHIFMKCVCKYAGDQS